MIAVVGTDFVAGELSLFDPATGELTEGVAITSGDPIVRSLGAELALIDRSLGDSLRIYSRQDWRVPRLELVIPGGTNLHDLTHFAGDWVAAPYQGEHLLRWRPDGSSLPAIDLSAWADGDGSLEADGLIAGEDTLLVALQRFDQHGGWARSEGRLLVLDPAGAVLEALDTAPSPRLRPGAAPGEGWLATGLFFQLDGAISGVRWPGLEVGPPLVTEVELGGDVGALAEVNGYLMVATTDLDGATSRLWCVELATGELVPGPRREAGWLVAVVGWADQAVVGVRSGWTAPGTYSELWRVDPATCSQVGTVQLRSEPYDLAVLP